MIFEDPSQPKPFSDSVILSILLPQICLAHLLEIHSMLWVREVGVKDVIAAELPRWLPVSLKYWEESRLKRLFLLKTS